MSPAGYVAIGLLALATLIMLHHFHKHGYWIDKHDLDNHETIAAVIAALGAGLMIGGM